LDGHQVKFQREFIGSASDVAQPMIVGSGLRAAN
jgi:hypothetical protein